MSEVTNSPELEQVLAQATDIAQQSKQGPTSAHLLLAVFTVPNLAELLLLEAQVSEETLLCNLGGLDAEPEGTLVAIERLSGELARSCDQRHVDCLHLLAAITRLPRSFAYRLLDRSGLSVVRLRNTALRYATHGVPQRLLHMGRALEMDADAVLQAVQDTIESPALPRDTAGELPAVREVPRKQAQKHAPIRVVPRRVERDVPQEPSERRSGHPGRRQHDKAGRDLGDRRALSLSDGADQPSPYVLNRERFPWLTKLGRNLSHMAYLDRLDPVVGRDREIEEAIDILNKRRSNNPCLVGEPGVGKTAIAEGMAARLVADHDEDAGPPERVVIQIDVGAILAGTHLRGALAQRLRGLQDEVRTAAGRIVVFIDEIHTLVGAGGGDGAHDASNELKQALARGEFPCVGATTVDEYRQHIEEDPALERRFSAVQVEAPDEATTRIILEGVVGRYADHHGVEFTPESLDAAIRMGQRYIHDRHDPDKSLGIFDLAGAVARRQGRDVDVNAVAEVVARMSRVPVGHLLLNDPQRYLALEQSLSERIVGQSHVLRALGETLRRNAAGFAGRRPIGSFLFLGPTGVGKTEAVKALAQHLFGSDDALVRFDMSEYLESHSVARLIGSPPGYVGHQDGGQLTESVRRRPYQVVLFDEIEKSHRDVWNVLLQVLDEGELTDSKGRTVDFSNVVLVMTSNLGAANLTPTERGIGFAGAQALDPEVRSRKALEQASKAFPPELWNRIESRLVFDPLDEPQIRAIARRIVAQRSTLLARQRGIRFELSDTAIDLLVERGGFDPASGARPMRQTIAREVESALAERILGGEFDNGQTVRVDRDGDTLSFTA